MPELAPWVSMQVGWDGFPLELMGAGSPAPAAQQTLCLLCNPLHEPPALGCAVQSHTGGAGSILPRSSLGPWWGTKLGGQRLQPDGTAGTPAWRGCVPRRQLCREGKGRVRFLSWWGGSGTSHAPRGGQVREPFGMDGLTGEKRARRGVCRREKSGKSPFPALLRVEEGQGSGRRGGRVCLTAGVGCSPPSSPSAGVRREGRRCQPLAPSPDSQAPREPWFPPALPGHTCPYSAPFPFPAKRPGHAAMAALPYLLRHARRLQAGQTDSRPHAGLEELAHVRRAVQTGSGTCQVPRASPQVLPPLHRTPPQHRPLPQKPGGLLWRLREGQAAQSPGTERDDSGCSGKLRCQIPFKGLFKQFKTCSGSSEERVAAPGASPAAWPGGSPGAGG